MIVMVTIQIFSNFSILKVIEQRVHELVGEGVSLDKVGGGKRRRSGRVKVLFIRLFI